MSTELPHVTTRIQASNLQVAYGNTLALDIPHLTVEGKIVALIGHNGSGKSTFLKSILCLLSPRCGELSVCSLEHDAWISLIPEQHMAFSPENGAVFADVSVESYLKLWSRIKQRNAHYYRTEGASLLEYLSITPLLKKLGRELSKGQRRRVQIAAGLLCSPKLLLLDEPFDGLDMSQSSVLSSLFEKEGDRRSMIISSHRMEVVERLADLVIVLEQGKILATGSVDEVCATLCGQSILISNAGNFITQIVPELRAAFHRCIVHSTGPDVSITGTEISLDLLATFLAQRAFNEVQLRPARPTLDEAMRYYSQKVN